MLIAILNLYCYKIANVIHVLANICISWALNEHKMVRISQKRTFTIFNFLTEIHHYIGCGLFLGLPGDLIRLIRAPSMPSKEPILGPLSKTQEDFRWLEKETQDDLQRA